MDLLQLHTVRKRISLMKFYICRRNVKAVDITEREKIMYCAE